jgi:hypothetical protein
MSFITNLFSSTPSEPTVPSTYTPASASGSSSTPAKPTKIPSDPSLVTEKNPEGLKPFVSSIFRRRMSQNDVLTFLSSFDLVCLLLWL